MTKESLLTSREAAEAAGLSYDGLIKAIQSGRIKRFVKIGNRNFFYPADMAAYRNGVGKKKICGSPFDKAIHWYYKLNEEERIKFKTIIS